MSCQYLSYLALLLLVLLSISESQQTQCINYIKSPYGSPTKCVSTSTDVRPINATAKVRASKNTTWYGNNDWTPYLARGQKLVYDLFAQANCYMSAPNSGKWIGGVNYEFSAKCTYISFELQQGDIVYFDLFKSPYHKTGQCAFGIAIPGYSGPSDTNLSQETIEGFKKQAEEFRMKRIPKENLRQQEIMLE